MAQSKASRAQSRAVAAQRSLAATPAAPPPALTAASLLAPVPRPLVVNPGAASLARVWPRIAFFHVCATVSALNKRNVRASLSELADICDRLPEARPFLVTCLLEELDHREQRSNQHASKVALIQSELAAYVQQPAFTSLLCTVFQGLGAEPRLRSTTATAAVAAHFTTLSAHTLVHVFKLLRLSPALVLSLTVALVHSTHALLAADAARLLRDRGVIQAYVAAREKDGDAISPHVLRSLLHTLRSHDAFTHEHSDTSAVLIQRLLRLHNEALPHALVDCVTNNLTRAAATGAHAGCASLSRVLTDAADTPAIKPRASPPSSALNAFLSTPAAELATHVLSTGSTPSLTSLAASLHASILSHVTPTALIMDIGYACTSSTGALREALASVGRGPARVYGLTPLAEHEVARLLVAMGNSLNLSLIAAHDGGAAGGHGSVNPVSAVGPVFDGLASAVNRAPIYSTGRVMPASMSASAGDTWRHDVVTAVLREDAPQLDWARVVASLDFPDCSLASPHAFQFVVAVVIGCFNGFFPTNELIRRPWSNARAHIDALRHALNAPVDIISFVNTTTDPARVIKSVPGGSPSIGNHAWNNADFVNVLIRLAASGGPDVERAVLTLFDSAQQSAPELVLLGVARSKVDDGVDIDQSAADPSGVRVRVFSVILSGAFGQYLAAPVRMAATPLQVALLTRLWETSRPLTAISLLSLVRGIAARVTTESEQLRTSFEGLSRLFAVTSQLPEFVVTFLGSPLPQVAIEVAFYFAMATGDLEARLAAETVPASWAGAPAPSADSGAPPASGSVTGFKFEAWLESSLRTSPATADRFAVSCVAFMKRVIAAQTQVLQTCRMRAGAPLDGSGATATAAIAAAEVQEGGRGSVPPSAAAASAAETLAQDGASKEAVVRAEYLATLFKVLKHRLSVLNPSTAQAVNLVFEAALKVYPTLSAVTDHEIEELANAYFQKIYSSQQSISEVVDMLKAFRTSSEPRNREIFNFMVHNLFDEYRFFHKYPEKELRISGVLFGQLIQHQLLSAQSLGLALRYVMDALKKPPTNVATNNMYRFGIIALEQFKSRVPTWAPVAARLLQFTHLRSSVPELYAELEAQCHAAGITALPPGAPLIMSESMLPGEDTSLAAPPMMMAAALPPPAPAAPPAAPLTATLAGSGAPTEAPAATPAAPAAPAVVPARVLLLTELRGKLRALGEDLTVALAAASAGRPIPAMLPSVAAAAAAREAEEKAAIAAAATAPSSGTAAADGTDASTVLDGLSIAAGGLPTNTPIEPPPSAVQERYTFLINNMSDATVQAKADEITSMLQDAHVPWLADFIVKRAAAQNNFQGMYRTLLATLASRAVDKEVLRITYDTVRRTLLSPRIRVDARERTTLKNLGSWLGKITLARNRPILHVHMNLKEMLLEAYETGRLIAYVPFVANVLEAVSESRVFRPPNPWTSALLSLLRELSDVRDLKLNLLFAVEVLCKALSIDVKEIRPTRLLHTRKRPALAGNPDFKETANEEAVPGVAPSTGATVVTPAASTTATDGGAGDAATPGGVPAIPGIMSLVTLRSFAPVFNPAAAAAAAAAAAGGVAASTSPSSSEAEDAGADADKPGSPKAALRNVVAVAVDRAVRELIQPVVQRSAAIASSTARELINKDFATERDVERMRSAAHAFASDLASSLALVTSQDSLKLSIGNNIRNLLMAHPNVITQLPVSVTQLGDAVVNTMLQGVVSENMELACALVCKAAADTATRSVDEELASAYALRRAADAPNPFIVPGTRWPPTLPDSMRPRAGVSVTPAQMRVYEVFATGAAASAAAAAISSGAAAPAGAATSAAILAAARAGATVSASTSAVSATAFGSATAGAPPGTTAAATAAADVMGSLATAPAVQPQLVPGQAETEYNALLDRLTNVIKSTAASMAAGVGNTASAVTLATIPSLPADHELLVVLRDFRTVGLRVSPALREGVCILQAQKLFRGLYELPPTPPTLLDALALHAFIAALVVLRDVCRALPKDLVSYLRYIPEDRRFASDGVVMGLLRFGLLYLPDLDAALAAGMDAGRNAGAIRFAALVLQRAIVTERIVASASLPGTIELLMQLSARSGATMPQLSAVLEAVRASGGGAIATAAAERARAVTPLLAVIGPSVILPSSTPAATGSAGAAAAAATLGALVPAPSPAPVLPPHAVSSPAPAENQYDESVRARVKPLLDTWVRMCADASMNSAAERAFMSTLNQSGVLSSDASMERFFRVMMDLCVQSCVTTSVPHPSPVPVQPLVEARSNLAAVPTPTPATRLMYKSVDAMSRLVIVLVRYMEAVPAKVALVTRLLSIFARALVRDADMYRAGASSEAVTAGLLEAPTFDARPYLRLLVNLLRDLPLPAPIPPPGADEATLATVAASTADVNNFNTQTIATFANVLNYARPERVPGFAFAWLELVSHRNFLPPLLLVSMQRGWPLVHLLLVDLLRFLYPALRHAEMNEGVKLFYKGTLRLLLVLRHDFPEFLADYHMSLVDMLPPSCIQMRNLLLSATPRAVRDVDTLGAASVSPENVPECAVVPRVLGSPSSAIPTQLREEVEAFLRSRAAGGTASASILATSLKAALTAPAEERAFSLSRYSLITINALVLHVATVVLARVAGETATSGLPAGAIPPAAIVAAATAPSSGASDLLRYMLSELDSEGRYVVLNGVVNQLRYPNAHTLFFSKLLLSLFLDGAAVSEIIREQVTRVLLERLIAHRPHPWGLMVTFIELIRNPVYAFWGHAFTRINSDIERLLHSVSRLCTAQDGSGDVPLEEGEEVILPAAHV